MLNFFVRAMKQGAVAAKLSASQRISVATSHALETLEPRRMLASVAVEWFEVCSLAHCELTIQRTKQFVFAGVRSGVAHPSKFFPTVAGFALNGDL